MTPEAPGAREATGGAPLATATPPRAAPPVPATAPRGAPLAWRLGLVLGAIVIVVLLITGIAVNRVVSGSFESVLAAQQQARLQTAADALVDALSRPNPLLRSRAQLQRLATGLGGQVTVHGPNGGILASVGAAPAGATTTLTAPITSDGDQIGTLEATVPEPSVSDQGFLRIFDVALIAAGLLSMVAIALLAVYGANRLVRPLRSVVLAAQRLGGGDLAARAQGGSDRESAELADAFNRMADQLQRSEMLRRRAASDMAHDLATPATVLESQLQAMLDGVVPADPEQLEAARAAASALGSVIGQMGELASAEAAGLQRRPIRVDLGELARNVLSGLDGMARDRGVATGLDATPSAAAFLDRDQLARAVRNVVSNALQHSPRGGEVNVTVAATPRVVELRVTDQGPGIAPADVPHVFERFYRADPSRSTANGNATRPGSGIGLTIARDLITANGGEIRVERTGPDGTTFLVRLPRVD